MCVLHYLVCTENVMNCLVSLFCSSDIHGVSFLCQLRNNGFIVLEYLNCKHAV